MAVVAPHVTPRISGPFQTGAVSAPTELMTLWPQLLVRHATIHALLAREQMRILALPAAPTFSGLSPPTRLVIALMVII